MKEIKNATEMLWAKNKYDIMARGSHFCYDKRILSVEEQRPFFLQKIVVKASHPITFVIGIQENPTLLVRNYRYLQRITIY
ncbi:hypothetical protein AWH56_024150 [Anaerobacillus isosaccharinicus]|uniref:Uncharacterized protein n=1 Tax=Anaerobacillus isosaccharinicus TaxID=1532552 RepID=A0A7S7RBC0_9BACI|nr:hypothetical protein [Anaerobacillus isosaccharinicus]MBA5586004.1 hypothetical protein [Anaerobacillus isosaccharinicus]QOY35718.1 hypothetical protein AWH56_024150 [Anaerobacillus isosaccharinicus]